MKKRLFFGILFCFFASTGFGQRVGLETNGLYWLTTTPNLGVEVLVSHKSTVGVLAGFNPFRFPSPDGGCGGANPKFFHFLVVPEYKYWFCRPYERWYVGAYGDFGRFNVGGVRLAGMHHLEENRYEGSLWGAGISAGYQWAFARRWGLEASLGLGYLNLDYSRYEAGACGGLVKEAGHHFWGPTRARLSVIYYLY